MAVLARLTLGNSHILLVDAAPDGATTAPVGSMAYMSTGVGGPWANKDGATAWALAGNDVDFRKIAADSMLDSSAIAPPATETIHTALALPVVATNVARTVLEFHARLRVIASVGADTWRVRARVGGLAPFPLIADSTAWDIANGDVVTVKGRIQIATIGAGGTFDAETEVVNYRVGTRIDNQVTAQAIDTTAAVSLVITGECSAGAPNVNQVSLTDFWCRASR